MTSNEIKSLTGQYVMGTYGRFPVVIDHGEGAKLYDPEGNEYIDFTSGIGVTCMGYGNDAWVDAVAAQAKKLSHVSNLFYTEPPALLAQKLCERTGESCVFFANGGGEANEGMIKLARKYSFDKYGTGRSTIITLKNSFHGRTITTLKATGQDVFHNFFFPFTEGFRYAAANDWASLEEVMGDDVCAIMVELVQGEGGVLPLDYDYVQKLKALCDEKDLLLLADEVQTGIGRTGKFLAVQHWNVKPDIICMAKGLCSGYAPVGAVGCRDFIHEAVVKGSGGFWHGHTLASNPVAMSAGVAVLPYLKEHDLIENSARMGEYLLQKLYELKEKYPQIGDVKGKGLMTGFELVKDRETREPYDPKLNLTNRILTHGRDSGIMLYGAPHCIDGTNGDAIMISPPLTVTKEQINEIIEYTDKVLADVFAKLGI